MGGCKEMLDLPLLISLGALAVSSWTLWATLLKRGTVKMTRPTVIYLGPDASDDKAPKVFLRFLLYATSRRGRVLQSLYVRLRSPEATQAFPIWVYGDEKLTRGSGLFVGPQGVATNHHFLLSGRNERFQFNEGPTEIEVLAFLVGDGKERSLGKWSVEVTAEHVGVLSNGLAGVYFDWGGDHRAYTSKVDEKPSTARTPDLSPSMLFLLNQHLEQASKDQPE